MELKTVAFRDIATFVRAKECGEPCEPMRTWCREHIERTGKIRCLRLWDGRRAVMIFQSIITRYNNFSHEHVTDSWLPFNLLFFFRNVKIVSSNSRIVKLNYSCQL